MRRIDATSAVLPTGVVAPVSVLVADGRVVAAAAPSAVGATDVPTAMVDATLVPGFVDLQVNGIAGQQYGTPGVDRSATAGALLRSGVTAHCPTITTRPLARYAEVAADLARGPDGPAPRDLGLHLEGPFLSPAHCGAHDAAAMCNPTDEAVDTVLAALDRSIAIWTLAPERPGALDAIRRLATHGTVVSAGHTDATFAQVRAACDAGLRMVTHVFNAQRGVHHREPGTAGAALTLDDLVVGIILDDVHVHPALADLVLRAAAGRVVGVTDAVATAGLPPGRHEFGGVVVDTTSGAPRLADGTLAGSNLTMDGVFRRVATVHGLGEAAAVTATTPAAALGRTDLGTIAPGAHADLVALDADLQVTDVWLAGDRVS